MIDDKVLKEMHELVEYLQDYSQKLNDCAESMTNWIESLSDILAGMPLKDRQ